MAVKGIIDRINAGPLADARTYPAVRAQREANQDAQLAARQHQRTAAEFSKIALDKQHAAGGRYAAFRGKKLAPAASRMTDANGRGVGLMDGLDVLNDAYDD
jgi:hypothetical protein